MDYYQRVKRLTISAIFKTDFEYKGYSGNNAISLYLNDNYSINVVCDDTANRAFIDAITEYHNEYT